MKMQSALRLATTLVLAGTLGACALTPQKTELAPEVVVGTENIGNGRTVSVSVKDERPDKSFGRRGTGAIAGAEISSDQDLEALFSGKISEGLTKRGFVVVPAGQTDADVSIVAELRELKYTTSMGFWTGGVHVNGAMKAIVSRQGRSYEQLYRSAEEQRVIVVNSASENSALINSAATNLLQQMADDKALLTFLTD